MNEGGEMMPSLIESLKATVDYSPETGEFTWLVDTHGSGGAKRSGDLVGTPKDGYVQLKVLGRVYRAHRLAWLFMTGAFPAKGMDIDHINGNRSDNRWSNLRLATRTHNNMNTLHVRPHTSEHRGVSWRKGRGKWHARIHVNKKVVILGDFDRIEDAVSARQQAERKYYADFIRK